MTDQLTPAELDAYEEAMKDAGCLDAISDAHDGDCTKKPYTCLRCEAERSYKQADEILALLNPVHREVPNDAC